MSGIDTPLRIEIIDPVADPPVGGPVVVARAAREPFRPGSPDFVRTAPGWSRLAEWFAPTRRRWASLARRGQEIAQRLGRRRAQRTHDGSARQNSSVRHHVFLSFAEARGRLPDEAAVIAAGSGRLILTTPFEPLSRGGVRARATLRLRGSWPALPVWVTVEPWWRSRTIATVALRSTRRLRYPRRYFGAAHAAMREIDDLITAT